MPDFMLVYCVTSPFMDIISAVTALYLGKPEYSKVLELASSGVPGPGLQYIWVSSPLGHWEEGRFISLCWQDFRKALLRTCRTSK